MAEAAPSSGTSDSGRRRVEVSISVPTMLLVAAAVAIAWAVASIANILLVIFVATFNVAVLLPVVSAMERRLGWSRKVCATVLVLGLLVVVGGIVVVLVQSVSGAVRGFAHDLPRIVDDARRSDLGRLINGGSDSLGTLQQHSADIAKGVGKASGGLAHLGVSAFGAVTLSLSVIFLTLFGLIDEPRARSWVLGLLEHDKRQRVVRVTDRIIHSTSRYMIGNLAISVVCGVAYGVTALILDVPYPLALALVAGILDLIPNIGATIAGIIVGLAALSVSLQALIIFLIVIVAYQQVENYVLQPAIIGKAAQVGGFTVLTSVLAFGALFGLVGAVIGVPIAAAIQIVAEELTVGRRARIAAADTADSRRPGCKHRANTPDREEPKRRPSGA